MKPLTIEQTIQIAHDCGLNWLDEAYDNVMRHYDCFFEIARLNEQIAAYDKLFIDRRYTIAKGDHSIIRPLLIVEVAQDLGYTFQELIIPDPVAVDADPCFEPVDKEAE